MELIRKFKNLFGRIWHKGRRMLGMGGDPAGTILQKVRTLELRGFDDKVIHNVIKDFQEFNRRHYQFVYDPIRVVSLIESILYSNQLKGDAVECGVYQGASAKIIRFFLSSEKKLHLFDTFTGFTLTDRAMELQKGTSRDPGRGHINTSLDFVKQRIFSDINGLKPSLARDAVLFHVGAIPETLGAVANNNFSFVHLDMDLYEPTKKALEFFVPRMVPKGVLILHDFAVSKDGYTGVLKAFQDYNNSSLIGPLPFGDSVSVLFIKE